MNMNPRKAIVGPTTILRVENISGLNAPQSLDPKQKPKHYHDPGDCHEYKIDTEKGHFALALFVENIIL